MSDFINYNNLYKAYRRSRRGKRKKRAEARFEYYALEGLNDIEDVLKNEGEPYKPLPLHDFIVREPKERLVQAPNVRDKIVLHLLCDEYIYNHYTRSFIRDNYASQENKGPKEAQNRIKYFLRQYFKEYGAEGFVLKADVRKFFASIPHWVLRQRAEKIPDPQARQMILAIIDAADGLPLGFQTSQILALDVLNPMDHRIKEKWRIKYYGRYMDDFYIIHHNKAFLKKVLADITVWLAKIGLELNEKTQIFPLQNGIRFLGWHYYLTEDGSVVCRINQASRERHRRKIKNGAKLYAEGKISGKRLFGSHQSWRSYAKHGNCRHLIEKFDRQYKQIFEERKE